MIPRHFIKQIPVIFGDRAVEQTHATKLYDRRRDEISVDEVEKISI
jgi:hypothetical protein